MEAGIGEYAGAETPAPPSNLKGYWEAPGLPVNEGLHPYSGGTDLASAPGAGTAAPVAMDAAPSVTSSLAPTDSSSSLMPSGHGAPVGGGGDDFLHTMNRMNNFKGVDHG